MSSGTDGNSSAALAASGSAFTLLGGTYLLLAHINAASGLTAGLQTLSADGTSYVPCSPTYAHVNGYQVLYLPSGTYKWAVSGSAGAGETFDLSVWRVPAD
jgi:hypothetical protein